MGCRVGTSGLLTGAHSDGAQHPFGGDPAMAIHAAAVGAWPLARLKALEAFFIEFEDMVVRNTAFSREQGHAITKLQEGQFWCTKAIEMERFIEPGAGVPADVVEAPRATDAT
jgi:hypothetical protein